MKYFAVLLFVLFPCFFYAQQNNDVYDGTVMFYNLENLFDCVDDPNTIDEEFLPESARRWNRGKLYEKLIHLAKVIINVGGDRPPDLVGVCEIENSKVLDDLIYKSPLEPLNYKYLHQESIDRRGIDVGLLYQPDSFTPLLTDFIRIKFDGDSSKRTRDILYTKGVFLNTDTIHVFVNHWPSRYSGYMQTVDFRKQAAQTLRSKVDSIFKEEKNPRIIIMGDLNDSPEDESLFITLEAKNKFDTQNYDSCLYNLMACSNLPGGTLKHQGKWQIFDHIIVSGSLINGDAFIQVAGAKGHIFKPDYLLESDEKYMGVKPFRTYIGFKHNGGFSDHLPVFIRLLKN